LDFAVQGRTAPTSSQPWRTPDGCLAPPRARRKRQRRRRPAPIWRWLRTTAAVGAVCTVAVAAAFPSVRAAAAAVWPAASPAAAFGQDHVRLLLLGADRDYDARGRRLEKGGRADTMILADLDLVHNTAHLCSIPRDTEARIPGHGVRRINSAFAYGGTELAKSVVEDLTGLPIDHTVAVDLDAFKEAVDALGGVDVVVDKPLRYTDHWGGLDINIPAGPQHLNGEKAMQFVRFRHDAMADIGRARRQQQFMRSLGSSLKRPAAIAAVPGVLGAVSRHTTTDLTAAQMVALGRFASGLNGSSLSTETLPGSFHGSRWRPDPDAMKQMAARLSL
jgi:LCP family protein required for cell wall assembly